MTTESILLGILGGGLITIATAIFIEYLRLPKLTLSIETPVLDMPPRRHLRLVLHNKPLPRGFRWILRSAALQCRGEITFHNLSGQNLFDRAMAVRWASSPEPGQITGQIFDVVSQVVGHNVVRNVRYYMADVAGIASTIDVYPGEQEVLDVAVRFEGESDCYGWNNESYFHNMRTEHWRLQRGTFLIKAVIASSGNKCVGKFRLISEVDALTGFRLTPLLAEDKGRLD